MKLKSCDVDDVQKVWDGIKALDLPFADRLSVFWCSYSDKHFKHGVGRFPALDRQDFIENDVLLEGQDLRDQLSKPSHEKITIESARFIPEFLFDAQKFDQLLEEPQQLIAKGARYVTKLVLFPARLIFTLDNLGVIGSNQQAIDSYCRYYVNDFPQQCQLLKQAIVWRSLPHDAFVTVC